jgi:hypothetical protein
MKGEDMSIHVTDFKWEKGNNDLQYIELLENTLKNEQAITAKAIAKIRELSIENSELYNEAQAERVFLTERDAEIRAKVIDEFAERMKRLNEEGEISVAGWNRIVDNIAEQMKAGGIDG